MANLSVGLCVYVTLLAWLTASDPRAQRSCHQSQPSLPRALCSRSPRGLLLPASAPPGILFPLSVPSRPAPPTRADPASRLGSAASLSAPRARTVPCSRAASLSGTGAALGSQLP